MERRESSQWFGGWQRAARPHPVAGGFIALSVLACVSVLWSWGCEMGPRRAETTSSVPALKYELGYRAGSLRSALAPVEPNLLRAEDSLPITTTLAVARRIAAGSFVPLESQTSMITVLPADRVVTPVARLMKGAKIGSVEDADRFIVGLTTEQRGEAVLLQRLRGVLPPDVTASFCFLESDPNDSASPEGIEVHVCRRSRTATGPNAESAPQSLEVALVASGRVKQKTILGNGSPRAKAEGQSEQELDSPSEELQVTETIFLEPRLFQEQDRFVVIVPSPFEAAQTVFFVIAVDVSRPPDQDSAAGAMHRWSFNECMSHLVAAKVTSQTPGSGPSDSEWSSFENTIRALQSPVHQRQVLLYLAEQADAPLAGDIALSETDTIVARLSEAVTKECSSGPAGGGASLGWRLERTAYSLLIALLSAEQQSPELEAILVRHTGQVGRQVSTLEELTTRAAGMDEFQSLLVRENFIYLEDISPAARARAFEWLTAKGRAPKGYDPLAGLKERRAALNRVEEVSDLK